jgi:hypothetical protein
MRFVLHVIKTDDREVYPNLRIFYTMNELLRYVELMDLTWSSLVLTVVKKEVLG